MKPMVPLRAFLFSTTIRTTRATAVTRNPFQTASAYSFPQTLFGPRRQLTTTNKYKNSLKEEPLVNEALRDLPTVRLIAQNGENCGTMSGEEALRRAKSAGLDVVQVSGGRASSLPVLKILDYPSVQESRKRIAYKKNKADKESRKLERRESSVKQIRLSPATDTNDLAIKLRRAKQFLIDGYRVKVFMVFRRGQGALGEVAKLSLIQSAQELSKVGRVQGLADGAPIESLFSPKKKSADEMDDEAEELSQKKPMEVLIYPLPRKERASLLEKSSD